MGRVTWLYVPGLLSAQAEAGSNSALASCYLDTAPSLAVSNGVLVLSAWMQAGVVGLRQKFVVRQLVMRPIVVLVMDLVALGNRSIRLGPDHAVKQFALAIRGSVVASVSHCVLAPAVHHEGQRTRFVTHWPTAKSEHFVGALTGYFESFCDLGKAITLLVERIHGGGLGVVAECWHDGNYIRRGGAVPAFGGA